VRRFTNEEIENCEEFKICDVFLSPLVGEGGSPRSGETDEGYLSARTTLAIATRGEIPLIRRHSRSYASAFVRTAAPKAAYATFSHKGRKDCTGDAARDVLT